MKSNSHAVVTTAGNLLTVPATDVSWKVEGPESHPVIVVVIQPRNDYR